MSTKRSREKKPISYQMATIKKKTKLSERVQQFTLQPEKPFDWIPGQFIITKNDFDGKDHWKSNR